MAIKGKVKSYSVAESQFRLLTNLKVKLTKTRDNHAGESHQRVGLENMQKIHLATKRGINVGRNGGSSKLPVNIIFFICNLLVNGTPPSAVAANIQTIPATVTGLEVN